MANIKIPSLADAMAKPLEIDGKNVKGDYATPAQTEVKAKFIQGFMSAMDKVGMGSQQQKDIDSYGKQFFVDQVVEMVELNRGSMYAMNSMPGKYYSVGKDGQEEMEQRYSMKNFIAMNETLKAARGMTDLTGEDWLTAFSNVGQIDYFLRDFKVDKSGELAEMQQRARGGASPA